MYKPHPTIWAPVCIFVGSLAFGQTTVTTNQTITPNTAPGTVILPLSTGLRPDNNADGANAITTALSPDGKTLLVLTSGFNTYFLTTGGQAIEYPVLDPVTGLPTSATTRNAEWVFIYDVSGAAPIQVQKINLPNTFAGLAWDPRGSRFFVSGGIDDLVYSFKFQNGSYVPDAPFVVLNTGSQLDNTAGGKYLSDNGLASRPIVAGVAVNGDGSALYTANYENDSVSIVDTAKRQVTNRQVFFSPGGKVAQGEYPFWVAARSRPGRPDRVFVSSQRDGQVLFFEGSGPVSVIKVGGEPNRLLLSNDGTRLYVANGDRDAVNVIDADYGAVIGTISLSRPGFRYKGANPDSLALSPDNRTLYVTLGGENAVAVIDLTTNQVAGRIPTAWYPTSVSVSGDGSKLFVVNAKSMPGPNPYGTGSVANPTNLYEYIYALQKSSLAMIPVPDAADLLALSKQVDANNGFNSNHNDPTIQALSKLITHVIYIVKENRTYDQILGDLPVGNGDPALAIFGGSITPNHHRLAQEFVTLDNFYATSEVSGDGWNWTTQGQTNEYIAKSVPLSYGNGFGPLDVYATDRNIVVGFPDDTPNPTPFNTRVTTLADPSGSSDILPGSKDIGGTDGDGDLSENAVGGYIWDAALRAGKTLRHYGYFTDYTYYFVPPPLYIPITRTPFASGIPQGPPLKPSLQNYSDVYYRGFDTRVPDRYHYEEWLREFNGYVAHGNLPDLEIMSLPLDHTGSTSSNVGGLSTPDLEVSDNDYALGKIVEAVSHSPYWKNTAIFVVEDDAQAEADHVDAHRSPAFVISPYTKRNQVVSTFYSQVSVLRTIDDLLGLNHLSLFEANTSPMADVFTLTPDLTPYSPTLPGSLCAAPVHPDLIPECSDSSLIRSAVVRPLHDGKWWESATKSFDFRRPDGLDAVAYNRVLWKGIKGDVPYPTQRSGKNLRAGREQFLQSTFTGNSDSKQAKVNSK